MKYNQRIEIGDRLHFKKFDWVIVSKSKRYAIPVYRYRVERRYFFGNMIPLRYTEQTYPIFAERWNFCKQKLKEDPSWHYTMNLWSGKER